MSYFQNKKEEKSGEEGESSFVCQVCGALVVPQNTGSVTAITVRFACPAFISTIFPGIGRPVAAALWIRSEFGFVKTASGP